MTRPNSDPELALDKLFELAVRLTGAMQRGLGERGLTASRAEVLLVLDAAGPMVQRRLSEALRCTPRYVTALIDDLEGEGLVKRSAHPTDRRATLVSLTRTGSAAAAKMNAERQEAARWLLGDVPAADLATFVAIADQVLERISAVPPPDQR
jgi:DNA-binding MarR family transcriptional regulator